jgi:hypothetical protein
MVRFREVQRIALAGIVASSVLLTPALARADNENAKPAQAAGSASSPVAAPSTKSSKPPVSPYVTMSRQHAEAVTGAPAHTMRHGLGQSPTKAKPARTKGT